MGEGPAKVVGGRRTTRNGGVEDDDTVITGVAGVELGEGRITEEAGTNTGGKANRVHIEGVNSTLPERVLHGGLLGARRDMGTVSRSVEGVLQCLTSQGRRWWTSRCQGSYQHRRGGN